MGMSLIVDCPNGVPAWPAVAEWLAARDSRAQMRMIDGQLAFPDEQPPADWHELRVALPAGMLTLRREGNAITVVTWGYNTTGRCWGKPWRKLATDNGAKNDESFLGSFSPFDPGVLGGDCFHFDPRTPRMQFTSTFAIHEKK